ncbi:hypothetical protein SLA2020_414620 [Shorea laevis]
MVAGVVISDHEGVIFLAFAKKLPLLDINAEEAKAALLAVEIASSLPPYTHILLEGDSLSMTMALNNANLCSDWLSALLLMM